MIEAPAIAHELLVERVQHAYGVAISAITFLPIGNDATAWIFRAETNAGAAYLFKLKQGPIALASVTVPHYLAHHGLAAAVAPLPTLTGDLTTPCGDFTLILFPLIVGDTAMTVGLSTRQWHTFGALIQQLHQAELPTTIACQLPHETFQLYWQETLALIEQRIAQPEPHDPIAQRLVTIWQARRPEIDAIVARTMALGRQLQAVSPPLVLCHADIHMANLLVDAQGGLHIIDWDGVLLAPKERDLIFVLARALLQHPTEAAFFEGYGPAAVDPVAFAYYRYEWVVQEVADYARRVLLMPALGDSTRADALQGFCDLFAPGDVVDVAYATEKDLPRCAR